MVLSLHGHVSSNPWVFPLTDRIYRPLARNPRPSSRHFWWTVRTKPCWGVLGFSARLDVILQCGMWWEPLSFFSSHVWISPTTCCWNSNCSRSDLLFFFFVCQCSSIKLASNSCLVDEMQMLQHLCLFWWYLYLKAVGYIKVWLSGQESNFLKNQVAVARLGDVSVADSVAGRNDCVLTTHFSPRCRGKKV